jgi:hypothetical protein
VAFSAGGLHALLRGLDLAGGVADADDDVLLDALDLRLGLTLLQLGGAGGGGSMAMRWESRPGV